MAREIKFKIWNKLTSEMRATEGFTQCEVDAHIHITWEYGNSGVMLANRDIEILQYTGLKDKNGREIYEGDVVRSGGTGIGEILWCSESAMFRVKWHDKIYRHVRSQSQYYTDNGEKLFPNTELVWEVIGNIYENADLLNS